MEAAKEKPTDCINCSTLDRTGNKRGYMEEMETLVNRQKERRDK